MGVGCESCHGGSEKWLATHYQSPRIPRSEHLANGLVALEKPDVLAGTCLGCHVGDQNRYANHRMMAAGHPRLVFELDTYLELWRTSGDAAVAINVGAKQQASLQLPVFGRLFGPRDARPGGYTDWLTVTLDF